jgi:hypothetical protein
MTLPSNRSCATPSPPPSPDAEPVPGSHGFSRRELLTLSAAWATVLCVGDTAWAAPEPARSAAASPAPSPTAPSSASYSGNSFQFDVFVRPVQDLLAIRYTVTNSGGNTVEAFTLSYIDNRTGRQSRLHNLSLGPGEKQMMDLYGGLDRTFNAKVCRGSSGECVVIGPVASSRQ